MRSEGTTDFWAAYHQLPLHVREQARAAYRRFRDNPHHPSLHFRRVHATKPIYSARIGRGWRAVGVRTDDLMIWFWIGSHAEYDHLLASL